MTTLVMDDDTTDDDAVDTATLVTEETAEEDVDAAELAVVSADTRLELEADDKDEVMEVICADVSEVVVPEMLTVTVTTLVLE